MGVEIGILGTIAAIQASGRSPVGLQRPSTSGDPANEIAAKAKQEERLEKEKKRRGSRMSRGQAPGAGTYTGGSALGGPGGGGVTSLLGS